jgi:predicted phosphate transport protein (TIGR00153 family)
MGLNNIIKNFLPKDKVFYSIFEQVSDNLQVMGDQLVTAVNTLDDKERLRLFKLIEDGEHKNDELTHEIFVELGQNFITPFDREDIHQLAMALDDVADYIYAATKKITLYNVTEMDDVKKEMSILIQSGINALRIAVKELRNMKHLRELTEACVKINSIENQADDLLDKAISRLFTSNIATIELIKLKDIYQDLEMVTDKCENASDVIESIIIKYA